jgi:NADPH2 dehydrogenase
MREQQSPARPQQSSKTHTRLAMATSKLFQPIQVGTVTLQHRVVMAPLARFRGNSNHTPTDLVVEHYSARSSGPGTLIISEATFIAQKASGNSFNAPGIWSDEQVVAWKKVYFIPPFSLALL